MMKKFVLTIISALLLALMTLSLCGCFILPKYSDPKSIEIADEIYVNGFYDNLWVDGITVAEETPPDMETKYHYWWKVDNAPFDMYCAQNKEKLYWNPSIYCKKSEYEKVKAYYASPENYDYFIGTYLKDENHIKLDEQYEEYAEKAIEFIIALDSTFGVGGIFDPFEDRKITVDVEFLDWDRVTIYRISKDGFFTTLHMELAIYNGTLYRHVSSDDSKKQTVFYCFDDDVSRHMVDAFLSYEII